MFMIEQSIIDTLIQSWINKYGVQAIYSSIFEDSEVIVFLVKNLNINKQFLPNDYKGYKIMLKESGDLITYNQKCPTSGHTP